MAATDVLLKHKKGTRAQLLAAATSNLLVPGVVYWMSDENRLVIATTAGQFIDQANAAELYARPAKAAVTTFANGWGNFGNGFADAVVVREL